MPCSNTSENKFRNGHMVGINDGTIKFKTMTLLKESIYVQTYIVKGTHIVKRKNCIFSYND